MPGRELLERVLGEAVRASLSLAASDRAGFISRYLTATADELPLPAVSEEERTRSDGSSLSAELNQLSEMLTGVINIARKLPNWPLRAVADALADKVGGSAAPSAAPEGGGAAVTAAAASAAAAAKEDEVYADDTEEAWVDGEGSSLEPLLAEDPELGQSPVRLLDARFLIALAKAGGHLMSRQELPEGAFFDLARLKRESHGYGSNTLRVLLVFAPWLQRDHPDPKGEMLRHLAGVIESFVADDGGSYAVFIAYCSLYQPGAQAGNQTALLAKALPHLPGLYAHAATWTLEISALPGGSLPFSATASNTASFSERGWTFLESHVTRFTKPTSLVLDLAKFSGLQEGAEPPMLEDVLLQCKAERPPPLLPADFRAALASKSFTDPADSETVASLYESAFDDYFMANDALVYDTLGWGDAQVDELCKVAEGVEMRSCKSLWLSHNDGMTDIGLERLATMLQRGALAHLETLHLLGNAVFQTSDASKKKVKEARSGIETFFTSKMDFRGGNAR
jgi:hypothetical protein